MVDVFRLFLYLGWNSRTHLVFRPDYCQLCSPNREYYKLPPLV